MAKPYLVQEAIDGKTYWYAPFKGAIETSSPTAFLLPPYDEYTIAYKDHSGILDPMYLDMAKSAIYGGVIVIDSRLVGNWKRTFSKGSVLIEFAPYRPLTSAELQAVAVASERFGEFLEMPVVLEQP
jgi:hypothetical protein